MDRASVPPSSNGAAPMSVEASRRLILESIGESPDMVLVRPFGNCGDELIWAGTRRLLQNHVYREVGIDDFCDATGDLAVLCGGGGWTRNRNDYMPDLLRIAELRFERVIVLPSSFEVADDDVRSSLSESQALVFAREAESFRQIRGICRAEMAHDCAFFADLSAYRDMPAAGTLNAFRVDSESRGAVEIPGDNEDISDACGSLEEWLARIASHAKINTDRAHVMIAGALMGRRVNYAPNSYFKVDSIARWALGEFDVEPYRNGGMAGAEAEALLTPERSTSNGTVDRKPARATVMVAGAGLTAEAVNAIAATSADVEFRVHDSNSVRQNGQAMLSSAVDDSRVSFVFADRDLGAAETLRLCAESSASEFTMFLSGDMRPDDEAISKLLEAIESKPRCVAATPLIASHEGVVRHCGGREIVGSTTYGVDRAFRDSAIADVPVGTHATGWVPTLGTLFRTSALVEVGLRTKAVHTQNAAWNLIANRRFPDGLVAVPSAIVRAPWQPEAPTAASFRARRVAVEELVAHAEFFADTGLVLADRLSLIVPELRTDGREIDLDRARLLLRLTGDRGKAWTLMSWMNGDLGPLLGYDERHFPLDVEAHRAAEQRRERLRWLEQRNEMLTGIENGGWWRLRERLLPILRLTTRSGGSKSEGRSS